MNNNIVHIAPSAPRSDTTGDDANRVLLQLVRLAHEMNERERALALVLLQSVTVWDGLSKPN